MFTKKAVPQPGAQLVSVVPKRQGYRFRSSQSTYRNQPMKPQISGTSRCFSLPLPFSIKLINK